jgi:hypothetical protein
MTGGSLRAATTRRDTFPAARSARSHLNMRG